MPRRFCSQNFFSYLPAGMYDVLVAAANSGKLVATSSFSTHGWFYSSEFIVDEWRESFVTNPTCYGRHRTHEAAVNCGKRYAKSIGLSAQRLEDAYYV